MNNEYFKLREIVGNLLDSPGCGGNVSVKNNKLMLIKPSGIDLKNIHEPTLIFNSEYIFGDKPSMEWKFHYLLKSKYVIHYHPIYVLPYLCSNYNFTFGEVVGYKTPGVELFKIIEKIKKPNNILFLKNHGVIIHANSIDKIIIHYNKIKDEFFKDIDICYTPDEVINASSPELYLFKLAIQQLSMKNNIKLNALTNKEVELLKNNKDEKYRKSMIEDTK
jgi:rhamnose utilization protein RhaD (predicted bifunctional aldolase and dehydrogenase)